MIEDVKKIIEDEMKCLGMKDRKFQEYLNESLSPEGDTYIRSHGTIIGMRVHGKLPSTDTLEDLASVYPSSDRRFIFALKLLAIKKPHVWGLDGLVWNLDSSKITRDE